MQGKARRVEVFSGKPPDQDADPDDDIPGETVEIDRAKSRWDYRDHSAALSPCHAAWRNAVYRALLQAALEAGERRRVILPVRMRGGIVRYAVFRFEVRVVKGARCRILVDSLTGWVYGGREIGVEVAR